MLHNLRIAIDEEFGTQIACAKAADIHPVRLNRICCGWVEATRVERDRLAKLLGVDSAWLFSTATRVPRSASASAALHNTTAERTPTAVA